MGAKSEQKVLDGIELLKRFSGRRRLDVGLLYSEALEGVLRQWKVFQGPNWQVPHAGAKKQLAILISLRQYCLKMLRLSRTNCQSTRDCRCERCGSSKVSIILGTEFFSDEVVDSGLDGGVLEALGGDAYEEMASNTTIDAQVRLVPPMFSHSHWLTLPVQRTQCAHETAGIRQGVKIE